MTGATERVGGVVLAAGASTRMGDADKLLLEVGGRALVRWPVAALQGAGADPIVVVTGPNDADLRRALAAEAPRFVQNPQPTRGLASSLSLGVEALADQVDALLVCLADMPAIRAHHVVALLDAARARPDCSIAFPTHASRRGHPVLFRAQHFAALRALRGDVGARDLIRRHLDEALAVPLDDGVVLDVDTPEALARLR